MFAPCPRADRRKRLRPLVDRPGETARSLGKSVCCSPHSRIS